LIGGLFKLAARVKFGHGYFESGDSRRMHIGGYASTVIVDGDGIILMEIDIDVCGKTGNGFVDGVVDDFFDEFVKAALVGGTDVHTRAFADRLQALKDFDIFGGIICSGWHTLRCFD
jgi:hypothetical protein